MLEWFFCTSGFNSKQVCGTGWSGELLWLYGLANLISFVVYTAFPLLVLKYLYPRHLRSVRPALRALIVFVMTCGLTHFCEAMTIWWPAYRLVTAIHILNNITSLTGLWMLVSAIRAIRFVPIRSELEEELTLIRDTLKDIQSQANVLAATSGVSAAIAKLRRTSQLLESMKTRSE